MATKPSSNPNGKYIDGRSMCAEFNVHPSTVWRWVRDGKIPRPIKLGGGTKNFWLREEIEAAIEAASAAREVAA